MDTLVQAKKLLSEVDGQISALERELSELKAQRKEISKLVSRMGGKNRPGRRKGATTKRATRGRGRPKTKRKSTRRKAARKTSRSRTRTNWNQVIARLGKTFSLDDLVKASGKKKPTVNQAVQNLKKAKKIAPAGQRGVYQRVAA